MTRRVFGGLLAATLLAGCGSSTVTTKTVTTGGSATSTSSTTVSTATTTAAPDTTSATIPGPPVPVGRTVLLSYSSVIGQEPDTQLSVRVTKVFPIPASDYVQLGAPSQLPYGVEITIKNHDSSTTTYDNGPEGDVELTSASGQKGGPSLLPPDSGPCANNSKNDTVSLDPGQSLHTCVTVEPPVGAPPAIVRFSPQGGLVDAYAEWKLH